MKYFFYISSLLLIFVSCKPSEPSDVLSPDDMADVLYDIHKAQAIKEFAPHNVHADFVSLHASVLKKYDLTEDEWQTSYNYYCNNADKLYGVYKNVSDRMEADVVALGGKAEGIQDNDADTANVWRAESSQILIQQSPYNRYSFEIESDTTFQDGDRITLQYDVQTLFQDGMKDIVAHLDIYYSNDSVVSTTTHNSFDGNGVLTVNNDVDRLHITKIRGYFLMVSSMSEEIAQDGFCLLRIAVLRNIKLLHLRTQPPAPASSQQPSVPTDSIKQDSVALEQQTSNKE